MKNIAIMIGCLHSGGAERIAGLLSKKLSSKYNVYLFLLDTNNIVYDYEGTIVDLGINGSSFIKYYAAQYKKIYKIDCAISFLEELNFINIQTKGTEYVIISERNTPSMQYSLWGYQNPRIKKLYKYADKIVAVADGVKHDLISQFGIDRAMIATIYNFIDKDIIYKKMSMEISKDILAFIGSSKVILNVGRLEAQKNQKKLLVQFSKLINEGEDVKLIIVGSGKLYKSLCSFVEDLGIKKYVRIMDYEKNPFPYYRIAMIFALTSDYEGLPNVVLEAMICKTAVAAVDCLSGPRELLKESIDYKERVTGIEICKNGILVEQTDSDMTGETDYFKSAMKILLHDNSLRDTLVENAKKYMDTYSNEKIGNEWVEVIEKTYHKNEKAPEVVGYALAVRKIIVYGAGDIGRLVIRPYLNKEKEYDLLCFAVSDRKGNRENIYGIPVFEIGQLIEHKEDAAVLIGVSEKFQQEVVDTVERCGFKNIYFPVYDRKDYSDYRKTEEYQYKDELSKWYMERTGQRFDWKSLRTYNEKLQWIKLYDCIEEKRVLSDKYQVRNYVREKIGERYLVPLLGCWDSFEQIQFDVLPAQFVLKCTHGPGWSWIVKDKTQLDMQQIKQQFESWMLLDYAYISGFGMGYKNLVPKIIAEEKIEGVNNEELGEYGVYVFDGRARIVQVDIQRSANRRRNLYSRDWEYLQYGIGYPTAPDIRMDKPEYLEGLIELSEKLCSGFRHVRVDFYSDGRKIYFNKMVFVPGNGVEEFTSKKFAMQMGSWILLPE